MDPRFARQGPLLYLGVGPLPASRTRSVKRQLVFFYGLFMDREVLQAKGVHVEDFQPASARGYALVLGRRATLVSSPAGLVFGMAGYLSSADLEVLYAEPSLIDYRPCPVSVFMEGRSVEAVCYNLERPPAAEERNPEYAARLRALAQRLHFPAEYVASIQ